MPTFRNIPYAKGMSLLFLRFKALRKAWLLSGAKKRGSQLRLPREVCRCVSSLIFVDPLKQILRELVFVEVHTFESNDGETFAALLDPVFGRIHGHRVHPVRPGPQVAAAGKGRDKREDLRHKLAQAIESEAYEEAARLRDEIRDLDREGPVGEG